MQYKYDMLANRYIIISIHANGSEQPSAPSPYILEEHVQEFTSEITTVQGLFGSKAELPPETGLQSCSSFTVLS